MKKTLASIIAAAFALASVSAFAQDASAPAADTSAAAPAKKDHSKPKHQLKHHGLKNRTVALIENGTWAPTAGKVMTKMLEGSKNITFAENSVKILSALSDESRAQINALATELAK